MSFPHSSGLLHMIRKLDLFLSNHSRFPFFLSSSNTTWIDSIGSFRCSLTLLKSGLSCASITVMLDCLCRRQNDRTSEHQAASCFCRVSTFGCNVKKGGKRYCKVSQVNLYRREDKQVNYFHVVSTGWNQLHSIGPEREHSGCLPCASWFDDPSDLPEVIKEDSVFSRIYFKCRISDLLSPSLFW